MYLLDNNFMTNIDHLNAIKDKLNSLYKGSFLNKLQQITNCDFLFGFSKGKDQSVIVSVNLQNPFVEFTSIKFTQNINETFFQHLKSRIMNATFHGARVLNSDNILCFDFVKTTDTYDKVPYTLIIELFKSNTNLILISDNKIVEAFKFKGMDTNRPVLNNLIYETPKTILAHKEFTTENQQSINEYIANIESKYLKEKYSTLISLIKRKKKSLNKKIENLKIEEAEAKKHEKYQEYGDYLKMCLYEVKRGDKSFEYNGEIIPLKETYSPTQNLQYFYKVYKKSKLTEESTKKYLNQTQNEIEYLDHILATIEFYNEQEYQELLKELTNSKLIKVPKYKIEKKVIASKPSYVVFNDTKIGFGKNSNQNNELTFNLANKSDYFLHINKSHGPHLIIFNDEPTDEVIQFACELALFLAKVQDGDVIYTRVSNLKKTSTLGQVRMGKYETYHINKIRDGMEKYVLEAKRF